MTRVCNSKTKTETFNGSSSIELLCKIEDV